MIFILGILDDGSCILISPFLNPDSDVIDKEKSPSCEPKKLQASASL
jgi:hypothetical protein